MRAPRAEVLEPSGFLAGNYEMTFDHQPLVGETDTLRRVGVVRLQRARCHDSPAIADKPGGNDQRRLAADGHPLIEPAACGPLIDSTQL